MPENEKILINRYIELASRAAGCGIFTNSEFLSAAEQNTLSRLPAQSLAAPYAFYGGYAAAERQIAVFGSEKLCGYTITPPITCLCAAPVSPKFADLLTHRDFLGALMALGIRREVVGDIVLQDKYGYIFCLQSIADYICKNFTEVKRTCVQCTPCSADSFIIKPPAQSQVVIASERLDALIAAVYQLPRAIAADLISSGRVAVNSRLTEKNSAAVTKGAVISVRGYGRFIYEGVERETRKGKLRALVRIY